MRTTEIIILLLFTLMALFFIQGTEKPDPEKIITNISNVQNDTFAILQKIPYTSQYEPQNRNMTSVMYNIINAIVYPIIVTYNTLIPYMTLVAAGEINSDVLKITIVIIAIFLISFILETIKGIIIIWFFIREKWKNRKAEKWYQ